MEIWHFLIICGIAGLVAEMFLPGFIAGSLGLGFIFAAIANELGLGLAYQVLGFALGTAICYFVIRPIFNKYKIGKNNPIKTDYQDLLGQIGIVTEDICLEKNSGRVRVKNLELKAISTDRKMVPKGARVEVIKVEGLIVIVKPIIVK